MEQVLYFQDRARCGEFKPPMPLIFRFDVLFSVTTPPIPLQPPPLSSLPSPSLPPIPSPTPWPLPSLFYNSRRFPLN